MTAHEYKMLIMKEHERIIDAVEAIKTIGQYALNDSHITISDMSDIMEHIKLIEVTDYTKDLHKSIFY